MVKIKLKLTNLIVVKSLMSTLLQLTIFTWVWWGRIWRLWWRGRGCPRNRWRGVSGHTQCCPSSCYRDSQYVREEKTKRKREIRKVKTWKGSRRSLLMQALLQPQEPIHEGFHTCIIFSVYDHIFQGCFSFGDIWGCSNQVVCTYILPEQAQASSIGAHIAPDVAATLEISAHLLSHIGSYNLLYLLPHILQHIRCWFLVAHQHLGTQVKWDHHPLICQGRVQCFKDHPGLNIIQYIHSCTIQK